MVGWVVRLESRTYVSLSRLTRLTFEAVLPVRVRLESLTYGANLGGVCEAFYNGATSRPTAERNARYDR